MTGPTDPALRALFDVYFEKHEDATNDEWCMKHLPRVEDVRAAYIAAAEAAPLDVELREAAQALVDALPYEPGSLIGGKIALVRAALLSPDTETAGEAS